MKAITWRTKYRELIEWTDEQLEVFRAVTKESDHIAILACAGGGKTFTAVYGCIAAINNEAMKKDEQAKIQVLCYNEHIASEIKSNPRIPNKVAVNTFHGLGMGLLFKYFQGQPPILKESKYYDLAKKRVERLERAGASELDFLSDDEDERHNYIDAIASIVAYAQSTLTKLTPASLKKMVGYYGLMCPGNKTTLHKACEIAIWCIEDGIAIAESKRIISFSDMVYLPIVWKIFVHEKTHVIVDEFQDLSAARLMLLNKFALGGARIILVGDLQQSIAGFSGADPRAAERAYDKFDPLRLYLNECFRCGSNILDLARVFQPRIMPVPGACEGVVSVKHPEEMTQGLGSGDLVICRYNAPLIDKCVEACFSGIKAKMGGDYLINRVTSLLNRGKKAGGNLVDGISKSADQQVYHLLRDGRESEVLGVERIRDALLEVINSYRTTDIEQILRIANELFNPSNPDVIFSTIHKIKGGEAERVWLLGSNLLPREESQIPWQNEQERNLAYVAITRAKRRLYLVPYILDPEEDGVIEDHMNDPYGGMTLPSDPVKVAAPPKAGQLSLF